MDVLALLTNRLGNKMKGCVGFEKKQSNFPT
jgi:hypothetical protein